MVSSRAAVEHDAALRHADDAVAIGAGGVERVQVGDDGDAVAQVDVAQRVHDDLGVERVERGDRLVGEDHLGLLHQGAGNGHALLLAAGQRSSRLEGGLAMPRRSSAAIAMMRSSRVKILKAD
jgi:hypothetical protein